MPHRPVLTVGSYNVHKGVGSDRLHDPRRTIAVIRELDADLVALQEVDRRFGDRRGVLDLAALRAATGLQPVALDDRLGALAHGWHGNLILYRGAEVEQARAIDLPGLEPRGAIVADLRFAGHRLRVIATHMGLLKRSRQAQAERLVEEIDDTVPTLMMGDMNEWRLGRRSSLLAIKSGLNAVATAQAAASFPARRPVLALDRIIGCARAEVSEFAPLDTPLARLASDHLPVRARVRLQT